MSVKIYFAGPLFSEAERDWIAGAKRRIEQMCRETGKNVDVLWPWELIDQEKVAALGDAGSEAIFAGCAGYLDVSDILVALLDGPQVDDGTAWEIGYFFHKAGGKSRILGIRTDIRRAGECAGSRVNAMIECSCSRIVTSVDELPAAISDLLAAL